MAKSKKKMGVAFANQLGKVYVDVEDILEWERKNVTRSAGSVYFNNGESFVAMDAGDYKEIFE